MTQSTSTTLRTIMISLIIFGLFSTPKLLRASENDLQSQAAVTENSGGMDNMDMATMQGMEKKMQEQIQSIQQTSNPDKRQMLLDEHMKSMQDMMATMRNGDDHEGNHSMMGEMDCGKMKQDKEVSSEEKQEMMKKHHQMMMTQRQMMMQKMDSMQVMMQQMLDHLSVVEGTEILTPDQQVRQ